MGTLYLRPVEWRHPPFLPVFEYGKIFENKNSPPVKLKELPNAENELRGVKSGLLGLPTVLHKPELNIRQKQESNT